MSPLPGLPRRVMASLMVMAIGFAADPPPPEHKIKAQLLAKLADYITWPTRTGIGDRGRPLTVGILGDSGIAPFVFAIPIPIKGSLPTRIQLRSLTGIENCDVIFISESESSRLPEVLRSVRGRPILTVADTPGFCNRGVMVNFLVHQGTIGLEVNTTATRQAGLEIGSDVLRRARIID